MGDPACYLATTCLECGRFLERAEAEKPACPHCGADRPGAPSARRVLTLDPPNCGPGPSAFTGRALSQSEMYVRCNFPPPAPPPAFTVRIPGQTEKTYGVDDLAAMPQTSASLVLECAGNGRTLMRPTPDGTPWTLEGASPIEVRGVRLNTLLGPLPLDVIDVVFTGADCGHVNPEGEIPYQFSIRRDLAVSGGPILATHIAGEPLTLEHGAPVRLVVPGHYAMKSVKWLESIDAVPYEFEGHFVRKYRYFGDRRFGEAENVGAVQPRSVIAWPEDRSTVRAGPTVVIGSAWTGSTAIREVHVTSDGGDTWDPATINDQEGGWVAWSVRVELGPGKHSLSARATDAVGRQQPLEAQWNENGYANNRCHEIEVDVVA